MRKKESMSGKFHVYREDEVIITSSRVVFKNERTRTQAEIARRLERGERNFKPGQIERKLAEDDLGFRITSD